MTPLPKNGRNDAPANSTPHLDTLSPRASMPGGEVTLKGSDLLSADGRTPHATIGDTVARATLSRPQQATILVPEGSVSGPLILHHAGGASNPLPLSVAVPMAENLHPVSNPAVDSNGSVFATVSGARGQTVPVSVFRIERDFQARPFVREILNATGLAFGPDGNLYISSRAEGSVYRVTPEGALSTYAEGLGLATGMAFDRDGNLYVGDRSGTIFKIGPETSEDRSKPSVSPPERSPVHPSIAHPPAAGAAPGHPGVGTGSDAAEADATSAPKPYREIFVFATLEPSMAAYHLAFNAAGTLFVTGPTTSSNQVIHTVDRDGNTRVFFQGLGRAQGMAFDIEDNLYVAASLHGQRGIVRITPADPSRGKFPEASLLISGSNLVGLAFLDDGCAALATRDALYHIDLGIQGRPLV